MRTSLHGLAVFVFAGLLAAYSAPHPQAHSKPPAIVIDQSPDYPMPDRGSVFPGGLVAALWRDGHMIRSTSPKAVDKSYIERVVPPRQCDEFFRFLSTATVRAPTIDGWPLHGATSPSPFAAAEHPSGHAFCRIRSQSGTRSSYVSSTFHCNAAMRQTQSSPRA